MGPTRSSGPKPRLEPVHRSFAEQSATIRRVIRSLLSGLFLLPLLISPPAVGADAALCERFETLAVEIRGLRDSDPSSGVERGESAIDELEESLVDCSEALGLLLGSIGSNLHILGRNQEALDRFQSGLDAVGPDAKPAVLATLYRGLGVVHADRDDPDQALEAYQASLEASEAMGDRIEVAKTSSNIGNLYNTLGELEDSQRFHRRALSNFEQADWPMGIAGASINLGSLAGKFAARAESAGDPDAARIANEELRDYNLRALEIFRELDNQRGIAYASNNIATALDRLGQPETAMEFHETALRLRQQIGDTFGVIQSLQTMATSQIGMGNHEEADRLLSEAEEVLPEGNLSLALDAVNRRVALEEARQDFERALEGQREATRLQARMAEEQGRMRVDELRESFEAEQREQLIELLQSEATVAELTTQRQRYFVGISLVTIVFLVAVLGLLYSRYRLKVRASTELARAARTDPLTGLANRREVRAQIEQGMQRYQRDRTPFSLIMADVDDFKLLNDRYGHEAGDLALVHLSRVLLDNVRGRDIVSRWGGEEFLLYLPDSKQSAAQAVADNLKRALDEAPFRLGDEELRLGMTFGTAEFKAGQSADACIGQADAAMYRGKSAGKNRVISA